MPAMAAITVKKSDGTTDIVYDSVAASGGDTSPAVWRQDTGAPAGLPTGLRASAKLQASWNGPKTARVLRFAYKRPYAVQDTTTTLYSAKDSVIIEATITAPQGMPAADISEGCYQAMNLIASSLMKSSVASGYAPT